MGTRNEWTYQLYYKGQLVSWAKATKVADGWAITTKSGSRAFGMNESMAKSIARDLVVGVRKGILDAHPDYSVRHFSIMAI